MKKRIAFLLSVLMLSNAVSVMAGEVVYGDADGNGELTAADAISVLQKVLNGSYKTDIEDKTEYYVSALDVDCDGELTAADSAVVLQKVLNKSYYMPVEITYEPEVLYNIENAYFNMIDIGYSGFDLENNFKGKIIDSRTELIDFYNEYIDSKHLTLIEYMSIFSDYDDSFFDDNILILSLDLISYSAKCTAAEVTVSGTAVSVKTNEELYYPAPDTHKYCLQFVEIHNVNAIDDVQWTIEKFDELENDTKTYYVDFTENKLEMGAIGWTYPNIVYWYLVDYPDKYQEQNYIVEVYKNEDLYEILDVKIEEQSEWTVNFPVKAHIDLSYIMTEYPHAEYTFRVKAVGDGVECSDSYFSEMSSIYINDKYALNESVNVSVSENNTIQLKIMNYAYPYEWSYSIDNDIIRVMSSETIENYYEGFDTDILIAGNSSCDIVTLVPVAEGTVNIEFVYASVFDKTDVQNTITFTLVVNENLNLEII